MHTLKMFVLFGLAALVGLAGCSLDQDPADPALSLEFFVPSAAPANKSMSQVVINNYVVDFDGRALVGGNTVFTWTVRGTGVEPGLSHFMIQLPECAPEPVAYSPTNSVSINTNPGTGIYGLEWHLSVEADDLVGRQYSITFPGDVPLGEVYSSVISGDVTSVGVIPGPCQGYDISGRVFVDANENGLRDPDEESGIANVIIELIDGNGNVSTLATDQYGDYSFRKLGGDFTINLTLDGYPGYFNSSLSASFDPTTILAHQASVPPDSPGNDFGFSPQSEEIIFDLENGVLLSDGRSLKFWKNEFRSAAGNGKGNHFYTREILEGFLTEVQGLFLETPYSFTPGNEVQEAFEILRSNSNEPIDELLAELLATELNHVADRGLVGQGDLQLVLIAWGEALVADFLTPDAASALEKGRTPEGDLDIAVTLFGLINTGGGGGVDE